jgi:ABC-type glycerol-3-phosphate transport system substrate-binding protein
MKKFFLLSALVALAAMGLMVAKGDLAYSGEKKTLLAWGFLDAAHTKPWVDEIERDFTPKTGIRIKLLGFGYGAPFNKILLAAAAGNKGGESYPDMVFSNPLWPMELYSRGAAVDFRREFPDYDKFAQDNLFTGPLQAFTFQNAVFATASNHWTQATYYRKDVFDKMGWTVPQTWDDVRAMIPKLREQKMDFAYRPGSMSTDGIEWGLPAGYFPFLWQHGGDLYDEAGLKSALDTPQAIASFNELTDLFTKHKIPLEMNTQKVLGSGELPILVHHDINIGGYRAVLNGAKIDPDNMRMALFPGRKKGNTIDHQANTYSWCWWVMKDSNNKQEAWQYLKWMLSDDIQYNVLASWNKMLPGLPWKFSNRRATEKYLATFHPREGKTLVDQMNMSRGIRPALGGLLVPRFILNAFVEVIQKGEDPEVAIRKAAAESNKEMKRKQKEFERFVY